jgi:radical SAM superfamily enzyme YgiQ (UPF0313 family)
VGFDSINRESLLGCGKRQNNPRRYLEAVKRLHDAGIGVFASFVFGLDEDRDDVFERTVELAQKARVFMAMFSILTPYPGTALHHRLKQENRLLNERWWLDPNPGDFPVFRPRHMTPERLYEGWQRAWADFYGGMSILRRMTRAPFSSWVSLASFLPLNLRQRRLAREKVMGVDKFFLRDRR